ncbi:MAG TPA: alkaline phosphatase PhoX [Actinomycetes bacterium]|nr:alkaline phosphatase PhoX [Actinomycetes bacterium]
MSTRRLRAFALAGLIVAATAATAVAAPGGTSTGPNTTTKPYVLPVGDGVSVKSLLTVGEGAASNGYEMVGIPDGLGLVGSETGSDDFTLLMNHELRGNQGVVRKHGKIGAFVSELEVDSDTYEVEQGRDLIDPDIRYWNYLTQTYGPTPSPGGINPRDPTDTFLAQPAEFQRFCSSSITEWNQLYSPWSKKGYKGQIYFANEENGDEGRLFGVTMNGQAQQLPRLGLFSWENTITAHNKSDRTVVIGNEDAAGGQLWVYVGSKQKSGTAFDEAGLTNGSNFVLDLQDEAVSTDAQFRTKFGKGKAVPFTLGGDELVDWDSSGARQNAEGTARGLTLNRIEDGVFDPRHRNDYYVLTTEGSPGVVPSEPMVTRDGGGLWHVHFKDIDKPWLGGTIELLLDGSEAPFLNKPDNMGVDGQGNLLIQEDPGNNAQLARIVAYDIDTGKRGVLTEFDPALFRKGGAGFLTEDEESSGIIDASAVLGKGWFLFDAQVHKASPDPAKVEPGQLLAMRVLKFRDVYTIK